MLTAARPSLESAWKRSKPCRVSDTTPEIVSQHHNPQPCGPRSPNPDVAPRDLGSPRLSNTSGSGSFQRPRSSPEPRHLHWRGWLHLWLRPAPCFLQAPPRSQHNTRARSRRGINGGLSLSPLKGRDRHTRPSVRSPTPPGPDRRRSRHSTSEFGSGGAHSSCPLPNLHPTADRRTRATPQAFGRPLTSLYLTSQSRCAASW